MNILVYMLRSFCVVYLRIQLILWSLIYVTVYQFVASSDHGNRLLTQQGLNYLSEVPIIKDASLCFPSCSHQADKVSASAEKMKRYIWRTEMRICYTIVGLFEGTVAAFLDTFGFRWVQVVQTSA